MKYLVLGVGNTLRGDDGFGPAVIERLQVKVKDPDVEIIDVGTSLSLVLWPLTLDEDPPASIVIVDVSVDGRAGLRELDLNEIPSQFFLQSTHLFPPRELLESLRKRGTEIKVFTCSVKSIPDQVTDVMTPETTSLIDEAVDRIESYLSSTRTMEKQMKMGVGK